MRANGVCIFALDNAARFWVGRCFMAFFFDGFTLYQSASGRMVSGSTAQTETERRRP